MTTFNIFHTTRVRIGVREAPLIWGAGEIRDAGERRLFGGLARSEPFVTPHIWGTGEMSTEIRTTYLGRWGNKHWKSWRIYVAPGHDELITPQQDAAVAQSTPASATKGYNVCIIFLLLHGVTYFSKNLIYIFIHWNWFMLITGY